MTRNVVRKMIIPGKNKLLKIVHFYKALACWKCVYVHCIIWFPLKSYEAGKQGPLTIFH